MDSLTIYENTTWEFNFWIRGFRELALEGSIAPVKFAPGRDCPVPPVPGWSTLTFALTRGGDRVIGLVDLRDGNDEIHTAALDLVAAYFKLNYSRSRLEERLNPGQLARVHPIGLWFPIRIAGWRDVPEEVSRAVRVASDDRSGWKRFYRTLRFQLSGLKLPPLEYWTETLANEPVREWDLFWKPRAWSGELAKASARRHAVMKELDELKSSTPYRMLYGFMNTPVARRHYPDHVLNGSSSKKDYLRTLSRSKIGIVTRGLRDSLNWGLGEHLSMRRFLLCERPVNTTHRPFEDGKHAVFFESDLSDLREKAAYYMAHAAEREAIAQQGRDFFDAVCAPASQARHILKVLSERPAMAGARG
jgi:hypothetical protein